MLLLVFVGFSWILIFNGLSRPASLSTNFPLSGPSTHFQQTTFAVSSFQLAQMVFNWFVGSFDRFSTGCVGSLFSTGFQQVFNWSSNRFSTSCDRLAVEFSRDGNRCQTKTASGNFFVYARTAAASVSARGEVMVELRRKGT